MFKPKKNKQPTTGQQQPKKRSDHSPMQAIRKMRLTHRHPHQQPEGEGIARCSSMAEDSDFVVQTNPASLLAAEQNVTVSYQLDTSPEQRANATDYDFLQSETSNSYQRGSSIMVKGSRKIDAHAKAVSTQRPHAKMNTPRLARRSSRGNESSIDRKEQVSRQIQNFQTTESFYFQLEAATPQLGVMSDHSNLSPQQKIKEVNSLLTSFFKELARFNFEKCKKMLNAIPLSGETRKEDSSNPLISKIPLNKLAPVPFLEASDRIIEQTAERDVLFDYLEHTQSFYALFNMVGLWNPIQKRGELYMHTNNKINEKFKNFIQCLISVLTFEQYYISFRQLNQEWKNHDSHSAHNPKEGPPQYSFTTARRDVMDFLQKIQHHPFYQISHHETIPGIDLQTKKLGVEMLEQIQRIFKELWAYLKVKEDCVKNYLNLWKGTDNKGEYFNDFMFVAKVRTHLEDLKTEVVQVDSLVKAKDPSMLKPSHEAQKAAIRKSRIEKKSMTMNPAFEFENHLFYNKTSQKQLLTPDKDESQYEPLKKQQPEKSVSRFTVSAKAKDEGIWQTSCRHLVSMLVLELETLDILISNRFDGLLAQNHIQNIVALKQASLKIQQFNAIYSDLIRRLAKDEQEDDQLVNYKGFYRRAPQGFGSGVPSKGQQQIQRSMIHDPFSTSFDVEDKQNSSQFVETDTMSKNNATPSHGGEGTSSTATLQAYFTQLLNTNRPWVWIKDALYMKQRQLSSLYFSRFLAFQSQSIPRGYSTKKAMEKQKLQDFEAVAKTMIQEFCSEFNTRVDIFFNYAEARAYYRKDERRETVLATAKPKWPQKAEKKNLGMDKFLKSLRIQFSLQHIADQGWLSSLSPCGYSDQNTSDSEADSDLEGQITDAKIGDQLLMLCSFEPEYPDDLSNMRSRFSIENLNTNWIGKVFDYKKTDKEMAIMNQYFFNQITIKPPPVKSSMASVNAPRPQSPSFGIQPKPDEKKEGLVFLHFEENSRKVKYQIAKIDHCHYILVTTYIGEIRKNSIKPPSLPKELKELAGESSPNLAGNTSLEAKLSRKISEKYFGGGRSHSGESPRSMTRSPKRSSPKHLNKSREMKISDKSFKASEKKRPGMSSRISGRDSSALKVQQSMAMFQNQQLLHNEQEALQRGRGVTMKKNHDGRPVIQSFHQNTNTSGSGKYPEASPSRSILQGQIDHVHLGSETHFVMMGESSVQQPLSSHQTLSPQQQHERMMTDRKKEDIHNSQNALFEQNFEDTANLTTLGAEHSLPAKEDSSMEQSILPASSSKGKSRHRGGLKSFFKKGFFGFGKKKAKKEDAQSSSANPEESFDSKHVAMNKSEMQAPSPKITSGETSKEAKAIQASKSFVFQSPAQSESKHYLKGDTKLHPVGEETPQKFDTEVRLANRRLADTSSPVSPSYTGTPVKENQAGEDNPKFSYLGMEPRFQKQNSSSIGSPNTHPAFGPEAAEENDERVVNMYQKRQSEFYDKRNSILAFLSFKMTYDEMDQLKLS